VTDKAETIGLLRAIALEIDEIASLGEGTDPCIDVIRRIHMIQTRLRQVHDELLENHLEHCLAAARDHEECAQSALDGVRDAFCSMNRSGW
jgi:DNA-binding FrmR family transcriptional regulator